MKRNCLVLSLFLFLIPPQLFSQDKKSVEFRGYLTLLQSAMFDSLSGPFVNENLLHNRLNFKGYITGKITFAAEFRNRLFTGDLVRLGKYYTGRIGEDPGMIDLSWNLFEEQSFLLNTTIDRLWLDFQPGKFQVTMGRQRINWGQTFVWNPNDIFNAYSFFDFDYNERPGSDAVRIQYFPTFSSAAEIAVKYSSKGGITAAGLYRFNKQGYDVQFLTGIVNGEDLVAGAGWSGSLGSLSFRGEGCWFVPYSNYPGKAGSFLLTTGLDKIFEDNSMAQVQIMYCSHPLELNDFTALYSRELSAKDLAYSEFTAFGQYIWSASPLLNLSVAAMWFPGLKGYFAGPSVDWSLAENLDFSLLWQHFDARMNNVRSKLNLAFLRLKYNF